MDFGRVFYMVGSGSRVVVRDASHKLKLDPGRRSVKDIGMCKISDDLLGKYGEIEVSGRLKRDDVRTRPVSLHAGLSNAPGL